MVISDEQIQKFQDIYRHYYGKEISKEKAYEQGMKLIRMLAVIHVPMTKTEYNEIQKYRMHLASLVFPDFLKKG